MMKFSKSVFAFGVASFAGVHGVKFQMDTDQQQTVNQQTDLDVQVMKMQQEESQQEQPQMIVPMKLKPSQQQGETVPSNDSQQDAKPNGMLADLGLVQDKGLTKSQDQKLKDLSSNLNFGLTRKQRCSEWCGKHKCCLILVAIIVLLALLWAVVEAGLSFDVPYLTPVAQAVSDALPIKIWF